MSRRTLSHDVFIAYSRTDKLAADAVCHRLEDAGIRCWIAPRDIDDDRGRNDPVGQAVGEARLAVVIFSAAAGTSRDMLDEVATVLDSEITVVPFRVGEAGRKRGNLRFLHWLDALNEPLNTQIDRLIDKVRYNLSEGLVAADAEEPEQTVDPAPAAPPELQIPAMGLAPAPTIRSLAETASPPAMAARSVAEAAPPPPEAVPDFVATAAAPRTEPAMPRFGEIAARPARRAAPLYVDKTRTSRADPASPRWRWLAIVGTAAVAAAAILALVGYQGELFSLHKPSAGGGVAQQAAAPEPPAAPASTAPPVPTPAAQPAPELAPKPTAAPAEAPKLLPQSPSILPKSLTVAGNSEATLIGIPVPADPDYVASSLTVKVTALPANGTILMPDGKTPVAVGQTLTSTELTGLKFSPQADVFDSNSTFAYTVTNPAGLSADGSVSLTIGPKPAAATAADAVEKGVAAFDRGNYAEAMRWYRVAADQGNADAQTDIGVLYGLGLGVKQDYDEALKWYRLAADQGQPVAQRNVGLFYQNGWSVEQDYAQALRWYRKAADQGEPRAQGSIGTLYETGHGLKKDYAKALRWFRVAADQGDAKSQTSIGHLYDKGLGVDQDYAEAMRWYRKAADQKDAKAEASIGYLYVTGRGVTQDYAEAMRWFRLAAEQGNAQAQSNIGVLYANGWGVERSSAQARNWMEQAAAAGDSYAKRWLAEH